MTQPRTYEGGCHCGDVKYTVGAEIKQVVSCNCSMCGKKGTLLFFVPMQSFKLKQGADCLTDYQFNKHVIHHLFCRRCGVTSFARGRDAKGGETAAINARCLEGLDLAQVQVQHYDGRSA